MRDEFPSGTLPWLQHGDELRFVERFGVDLRVVTVADGEEFELAIHALKPHDPDVRVTVTGGSPTSAPNAGRLTVVADPGATEVTVTVTR